MIVVGEAGAAGEAAEMDAVAATVAADMAADTEAVVAVVAEDAMAEAVAEAEVEVINMISQMWTSAAYQITWISLTSLSPMMCGMVLTNSKRMLLMHCEHSEIKNAK